MASDRARDDKDLLIRDVETGDYDKGYLELLAQLTVVGSVSRDAFEARQGELRDNPDYINIVLEDVVQKRVVAAGTCFLEKKFIHACGTCGHIEDIVVDSTVRGRSLGRRIITELKRRAIAAGCYKIILDCSENNEPFYEKLGFTRKEGQMVLYV